MEMLPRALDLLMKLQVVSRSEVLPLGLEDVELVLRDQNLSALPSQYRGFLRTCGGGVGNILGGSMIFYPEILGIKAPVWEWTQETPPCPCPVSSSLVFYLHGGYQVAWTDANDPVEKVSTYTEGDDALVQTGVDIDTWIAWQLCSDGGLYRRLGRDQLLLQLGLVEPPSVGKRRP